MAVHADSKIDLWLDTFNHDFYVSLTDKENWTYLDNVSEPDRLQAWKDYFQALMDAMNAWRNSNYAERKAPNIQGLISQIYTYLMYGSRYGTSTADLGDMDASLIFDMGGFMATTIGRPIDYYNDITVIVAPFESAKMDADIASLEPSVWQADEKQKLDAVSTLARGAPSQYNFNNMFSDTTPTPGTPMTKADMAEEIFVTLKWKFIKDNLPGVQGITVPDYIENPP